VNGPRPEPRIERSRVGEYLALALITVPAIGLWIFLIWALVDSWNSGIINNLRTVAGLVVFFWLSTLATLLARIGWQQRKRTNG